MGYSPNPPLNQSPNALQSTTLRNAHNSHNITGDDGSSTWELKALSNQQFQPLVNTRNSHTQMQMQKHMRIDSIFGYLEEFKVTNSL
eukprot:CAMPEP_0116925006 /NCGR_PEP_ID=MMETSP0467-20121206/23870_1 /TAXON_ID=283647 /ORGANISM="Mesodinium pulex, Strain SPMC105" /LENGTH=86 /DNA_ID=CAMNT_0004603985 /DNA_START=396 /DNA_END=656 /DNA_ORIENTATION=-